MTKIHAARLDNPLSALTLHKSEGDTGERTINIQETLKPSVANRAIRELLAYESADPGTPVHMFVFSPGGCVVSGLAIIDVMQHITSPVFTYAIGFAASMGAVILAAGERGHRYILPHSRVMIHQASGTLGGTLENVRATLTFQSQLENEMEEMLATFCGRTAEEVRIASRIENWMPASEALRFGLVDFVLQTPSTNPAHES